MVFLYSEEATNDSTLPRTEGINKFQVTDRLGQNLDAYNRSLES